MIQASRINGTELAVSQTCLATPAFTIQQAVDRRNDMVQFVQRILVDGTDYGVIPGTEKRTLLKAGAEKLATFFGLTTRFELTRCIEDWTGAEHGGEPLFYYVYRCQMYRGDSLVAESDGSCNSRDSKYRWRWVPESEIPIGTDKTKLRTRSGAVREPVFAVEKAETGGKYGKPAAHWERFRRAIEAGTARQVEGASKAGKPMMWWEIGDTLYRVPNEDIAGQINTIQKMSQKRALVGTALLAVNASEFFTQDLEDMEMLDGGAAHPVPDAPSVVPVTPDGSIDLSDDEAFAGEWDREVARRRINDATGRNFLKVMCGSSRHREHCHKPEWRREALDHLIAGDFDETMRGKPKDKTTEAVRQNDSTEKPTTGQSSGSGSVGSNAGSNGRTEPGVVEIDAKPKPVSTADLQPMDAFWLHIFRAMPTVPQDQIRMAVEKHAAGMRRTAEQLKPDYLLRIYQAAKEGRLAIPSGRIAEPTAPLSEIVDDIPL